VRAKQKALSAPIFCTNTAYFATLRHWHAEQLPRRRLLIIDEAHNLESQLVAVFTARFSHDEMRSWFGGPLPRLPFADDYRPILAGHVRRLEGSLEEVRIRLEALRPPEGPADLVLEMPPTREEQDLLEQRDLLESALARITFFLEAEDREWIVRYP
jgi:Rad3-related DNA helicase